MSKVPKNERRFILRKLKLKLIVEKGENSLWGRTNYNDSLLTDEAATIDELKVNLERLLREFEGINEQIEFEVYYDVFALFEEFDFINISKFAKYAGINPAQMRHYASGLKHPRKDQAAKIEAALHKFSEEISKVFIHAA